MTNDTLVPSGPELEALGWSAHFMMQVADGLEAGVVPVRISEVQRSLLRAFSGKGPCSLTVPSDETTGEYAVGDWVLCTPDGVVVRRLDRFSLLERRVAGGEARSQLIGANVDVLFIVTSCNEDFNVARLERYLVLAKDAGVQPCVVLTKADLADETSDYERSVQQIDPLLPVLPLDARDAEAVTVLHDWWRRGQTAVMLGSSGVGKTTLLNSLAGTQEDTGGIRADDAKGRHTTTSRGLYLAAGGRWLMDTPGMRELRLYDVADGVEAVFGDILELASQCRFNNCGHETEPDCAIQEALMSGALDADRLKRWQKLEREERYNRESIAEARARTRAFGRHVKKVTKSRMKAKGRGA